MYNDILSILMDPVNEADTSNLTDYELGHYEADYVSATDELDAVADELSSLLECN